MPKTMGRTPRAPSPVARTRRWRVQLARRGRHGARRARAALLPVTEASIAAGLAYWVASSVFGHGFPFFAPVAAWICLGFSAHRIPRRVAELGAGAVLGVVAGELAYLAVGSGPWQMALVLVVAALGARLVDHGDLFTLQAGVNAMVVMGLAARGDANPTDRAVDALIGALIAFVFSVLVPRDLTRRPRRLARSLLSDLAQTMGVLGQGLRIGSGETLSEAQTRLSGLRQQVTQALAAVRSSSEIARLNPVQGRARPQLIELQRQFMLIGRCINSIEMLTRQARGIVAESGPSPAVAGLVVEAAAVSESLSGAIGDWREPTESRRLATALAGRCSPQEILGAGWRPAVLVSVMRSVTIDLLQMTGLSRLQARALLPDLGDSLTHEEDVAMAADEPSRVWLSRPCDE